MTDAPQKPVSRGRRALVAGGAAAAIVAVWNAPRVIRGFLPQRFDFEPVATPPGFRRLARGETSRVIDPLIGVGGPARAPDAVDPQALAADICRALFRRDAVPEGVVPVASFSDYYCPHCRVLTRRLATISEASEGGVVVAWHEWPLFGRMSEVAARAALAARRQGAYPAFQAALMRGGFVPTPEFIESMAARLGIDAARMVADMESPGVAQEIAESTALARLFAFPGTPGLVVGRTLVDGALDDAALAALIDRERADGPVPGCA